MQRCNTCYKKNNYFYVLVVNTESSIRSNYRVYRKENDFYTDSVEEIAKDINLLSVITDYKRRYKGFYHFGLECQDNSRWNRYITFEEYLEWEIHLKVATLKDRYKGLYKCLDKLENYVLPVEFYAERDKYESFKIKSWVRNKKNENVMDYDRIEKEVYDRLVMDLQDTYNSQVNHGVKPIER